MNKKIISLLALLSVAGLVGCNPFGTKDELIARVGDEKIYRSDFDFARIMQPAYNKPEKYTELLSNLISDREFVIEARQKLGDPNESVEKKVAVLRDRLLSRIYQQFYVVENLGHTEEQLSDYYEQHPDLFKNDTCKFFTDCRVSVAKKVYLAENADSLNAFFESRLKSYKKPAEVDIAYFKSNDSLAIEKAQKSLETNKVVDSIPGMVREKLTETQNHALLKTMAVRETLFGKDALKVDGSFKTLKVQTNEKNSDSSYSIIIKVMSRTPATEKTLEEVRPSLEQAFIDSYRDKMIRESAKKLQEKFVLKLEKIEPPNARAYYDSHKDNYKTMPGFAVYHIESMDSLALMKVMNQPLTLVDFKKLASLMSINEATKAQGGLVGEVKVSHALPFGIGMMPKLFDEFQGKKSGAVSSVIKAPNTGRYHVFYLDKEIPSEVKPFERVEAQIKKELAQSADFALDSSYVLVTSKGKPIIYERDVLELQTEIPSEERRMYPRSRLLQYMMDWKAYAMEAEALELDESWYYKAFETSTRVGIYNKLLSDTLQSGSWGASEAELNAGYEKYGKTIFGGIALDKISNPLGLFLSTPEVTLKREYYFNLERYASFPDFEAAKGQLFSTMMPQEKKNWMDRYRAKMHENARIQIYDTTFLPMIDDYSRDSLLAKATNAYKARDLNTSLETWSHLRVLYAEDDTLYAQATLEVAKIFNENEKYDFAQREYRAYISLWPNNPDAEKALFSRAFILHENLKQDSIALTLFREFKTKYPKSELMESVDWLIRNIESNGKLAEELLEKISKQDESAK